MIFFPSLHVGVYWLPQSIYIVFSFHNRLFFLARQMIGLLKHAKNNGIYRSRNQSPPIRNLVWWGSSLAGKILNFSDVLVSLFFQMVMEFLECIMLEEKQ